ncbi:vesicle-trafficking protein SEC22b isoform X1 [Ictidomys tridecemlineatus]|uniref:vesicle-trafficking protein SEC22b isoform X1 n=2 Tax=Ictidomys tridecemlineatus TaxID=43179 RepID=UPI001A9F4EDA|nr:vesicle-trafficking protein SEC22b isoform X1 [Ictidomys tridecemlineatus]
MVLLTMIARVADGLPLAASMQEDEQSGRDLQQYQSQAKQLFRKLNEHSPTRCTLEAGAMTFHYIIEQGVCYLVLCEAAFPKKLAFAYLEDLHSEFDEQHGKKVPTVSRPYSFIEFDTFIQKTKKLYIDSRARRNLGSINTELQDVQRIMVANIEEVLQRGEALSALDSKANNLSSLSKKYRQDAKYLNMRSTYAKLAAVAVFFIMLIVCCSGGSSISKEQHPELRCPWSQQYCLQRRHWCLHEIVLAITSTPESLGLEDDQYPLIYSFSA